MHHSLRLLRPVCAATAVALVSTLLISCGGRYIETAGTDTIVSVDQINIQDWSMAADEMVQSLLTSGMLERAPTQPATLAVSRIVNNTTEQVDADYLTRRIRVALNQSGKVMTTTTIGLGDVVEDPLARKLAREYEESGDEQVIRPRPYFTLSGKLLEDRARAGRTRQVTYTFQLALTEVDTGLAVWEDVKDITKQGRRPSVGW